MKRRIVRILPSVLPLLGVALLLVLVWRSRAPRSGSSAANSGKDAVPAPLVPWTSIPIATPPRAPHPRLDLPTRDYKPSEPPAGRLMRLEREMWSALAGQAADPGAQTLGDLSDVVLERAGWSIWLDKDLPRSTSVRAANPGDSLADAVRSMINITGLALVPSELEQVAHLTRCPELDEWPLTRQRLRIIRRLRGEPADQEECAWLALERAAPRAPAEALGVRDVARWVESATALEVELPGNSASGEETRLRFPPAAEGETVASVARMALRDSGLDIAARRGKIVFCSRGEADALAANWNLKRSWTPEDLDEGLALQSRLDLLSSSFEAGIYPAARIIERIAHACSGNGDSPWTWYGGRPFVSADDATWDDDTLIALPEGDYTVRELRELLRTCAGIRMHVLKGELWFVLPEEP